MKLKGNFQEKIVKCYKIFPGHKQCLKAAFINTEKSAEAHKV